ncbi:glycine cleavage system protein GcvH [Burkholderia sp. Ac-20365]|nr:glycine cleavage system protein GcvH [Burkholderia sp. Ac-20365]MBN3759245.1 glycine cleavage system protein GcvH [Burkholderia sp. Ac-20365]
MPVPSELRYTDTHEWVRIASDGLLSVGITDHEQNALGEIVRLELPTPGTTVHRGSPIATIESEKSASDINAPVSGEIASVNESLRSSPGSINTAPYESWLVKIRPSDATTTDDLLSAGEYAARIGE